MNSRQPSLADQQWTPHLCPCPHGTSGTSAAQRAALSRREAHSDASRLGAAMRGCCTMQHAQPPHFLTKAAAPCNTHSRRTSSLKLLRLQP
eukprot:366423-Chlamydomonas_euryale.AAC.8